MADSRSVTTALDSENHRVIHSERTPLLSIQEGEGERVARRHCSFFAPATIYTQAAVVFWSTLQANRYSLETLIAEGLPDDHRTLNGRAPIAIAAASILALAFAIGSTACTKAQSKALEDRKNTRNQVPDPESGLAPAAPQPLRDALTWKETGYVSLFCLSNLFQTIMPFIHDAKKLPFIDLDESAKTTRDLVYAGFICLTLLGSVQDYLNARSAFGVKNKRYCVPPMFHLYTQFALYFLRTLTNTEIALMGGAELAGWGGSMVAVSFVVVMAAICGLSEAISHYAEGKVFVKMGDNAVPHVHSHSHSHAHSHDEGDAPASCSKASIKNGIQKASNVVHYVGEVAETASPSIVFADELGASQLPIGGRIGVYAACVVPSIFGCIRDYINTAIAIDDNNKDAKPTVAPRAT